MSDDSTWTLPDRYVVEDFSGRDVIRCTACGMRWYADRMTHWANQVFMTEHADRHKHVIRKRPRDLPPDVRANLPRQQSDDT